MNSADVKDENDEEGAAEGNKWADEYRDKRDVGGGSQQERSLALSMLAQSQCVDSKNSYKNRINDNKNTDTLASLSHACLEELGTNKCVVFSANGHSRSLTGCATTASANPVSPAGERDNNPSNADEGENTPEYRTGTGTSTRLSAQCLPQHRQQLSTHHYHYHCQPQGDRCHHYCPRLQQPPQEDQGHQTCDRGKLEFLFRRFNLQLQHGRRGKGDALEGKSDASRPSCMKVRPPRGCQGRGREGDDDMSAHKIGLVQNEDHGGRSRRCAPTDVSTVVVRGKSAVVLKDNVHRVEQHDAKPLLLSRHYERHLSLPRHPHPHRHHQYLVNKRCHRQARHQNVLSNLVRLIHCNIIGRHHRDRNRDGGSCDNNHRKLLPPCFDLLLCDPILQLSTLPEPASRSTILMLPSATARPMRMPPILGVASVTTVSTGEALSTNKSGKAVHVPAKADNGVNNIGDHGVSLGATATSSSGPPFRTLPAPPPPSVAAAALVCVSDETTCCPGSASVINAMESATAARSICPLSWTTLPRTDNTASESPDIPSNACAPVRQLFQPASSMSSPLAPLNVWDWDGFTPHTRTLEHAPRSSPRRSRPRPFLRSVSLSHSLLSSSPLVLATRGHFSDQIMDQTLNLQDQVWSLDYPLTHRQRLSFPRRAESVPPNLEGAIERESLDAVGLSTDKEDRHPENGSTRASLTSLPPRPSARLPNRKRRVRSWDSQGDSRYPEQSLQPLQHPQPHLHLHPHPHSHSHSQSLQPWFLLAEQLWGSLVDATHQNREQVVGDSLHKEIGSVRTASPAAVAGVAAAAAAAWCPLLQNGPTATVHKKKQHGGTKPLWAKSTFASVRSALPEHACVWMESDDGGGGGGGQHTTTGRSRRLQVMEDMELPPYLQGADTTPRTTSEVIFRTGAPTPATIAVATVTTAVTATPGSPASPLAHRRRLGQTQQEPSFHSPLSSITTSRVTSSPSLSASSCSTSSSSSSPSASPPSSFSSSSSSSFPYREKQSRARATIHSRTLQSTLASAAAFDGDNGDGGQVDGGGGRDTGVPLVQGANNGAMVNGITGSNPSSADSSNAPSEVYNRGDQVYESGPSARGHHQQHHQNSNNNNNINNNSNQVSMPLPQSGFTRDGEWVTGEDHERHQAMGMIVGCEDGFHLHPLDTHCPHDRRVPTLAGEDDSETELDCVSPGVTVRLSSTPLPPGSATASMTMMSRTLHLLTPPRRSVSDEQQPLRAPVPRVLPAGSTMMSRAFPTLPATPVANEPIAHQIRRIQMPLIEQLQRQYEEQIERQRSILEQSHLAQEEEDGLNAPLPDSSHPMLAASVPMSRQPAFGVGGGWRHVQRQASSQPPVVPQQSSPHPFESTSSRSSPFASAEVPESHRLQGSNTLYLNYEGGILRPQERWRRGDHEMLGR